MIDTLISRHAFRVLFVTTLLFPPVGLAALRALRSNTNNVADWLPAAYEETTQFQWFRKHFAGEQFVLLSWEGCTLDDPRLPLLVAKLVQSDAVDSVGPDDHYFAKAITGPEVLARLMEAPTRLSREEALRRLRGILIGPDGKTTCAVLTLSKAGEKNLRATVDQLTSVAENECAIPSDELHMGGPPVDNVAIDRAGERSLFRLAGLSAVIGLVLSWRSVRSVRLTLLIFATGLYSAALSLALVFWTGASVNAILLTMPPLVYVAATSGAIHLTNYYLDALGEGDARSAAGRAVRHATLPLVLATGTTAVGLMSLAISELVPIRQFGIYSAAGVVASLGLMLLSLPAALQIIFPATSREVQSHASAHTARDEPTGSDRWEQIGERLLRSRRAIAIIGLAVLAFCAVGISRIDTSVHLMRLFKSNARIIQDYAWLERHIGPLVPMEIVLRFDSRNSQLDFAEKLALVGKVEHALTDVSGVGGALSAKTFSPDMPAAPSSRGGIGRVVQKLIVRDRERVTREVFAKRLEQHREQFVSDGYLNVEGPYELWRVSARAEALTDVDYGQFVRDIKSRVEPLLSGANQEETAAVSAVYTGLAPLFYRAQQSLLDGLIFGFVTDMLLIIVAITFTMRDFGAGLFLAVTGAFPAVVVFGAMGWLGIIVDTGTVMTPAVALGVTVDDVVHYLIWFRQGRTDGLDRRRSVLLAYRHCGRPMWQSWGVIGLGLSVFILSPFTPTQRFGYLMVTLLTASLAGNLLLLPALLASPLGRLVGKRSRRPAPIEPAPPHFAASSNPVATAGADPQVSASSSESTTTPPS